MNKLEEVTVDEVKSYGECAYLLYALTTGGKNVFDGRDMPLWDEIPEKVQLAWKLGVLGAFGLRDQDFETRSDAAKTRALDSLKCLPSIFELLPADV